VDYEHQISRTEVTGAEWFEFVNAYAPYVQEDAENDPAFTSGWVTIAGHRRYAMHPFFNDRAVEVGWHFAARYANWLHNGRRPEQAAFESGAYDTSTFGDHPGGGFTDQITHSAGAADWIPSVDEWVNGVHFDPERYGPGMPGYRFCSNSSDTPPVRGLPGTGGETSDAGSFVFPLPDVASYPAVQSPGGLFDTSGGFSEWTEDVEYSMFAEGHVARRIQGTSRRDNGSDIFLSRLEYIDGYRVRSPVFTIGLRLARAVPGASSAGVFVCAFACFTRRRRRHEPLHSDPDSSGRVASNPRRATDSPFMGNRCVRRASARRPHRIRRTGIGGTSSAPSLARRALMGCGLRAATADCAGRGTPGNRPRPTALAVAPGARVGRASGVRLCGVGGVLGGRGW
jgi:formylglycine-generating enzyme required for sulfatase activity